MKTVELMLEKEHLLVRVKKQSRDYPTAAALFANIEHGILMDMTN